MKKEPKSYFGSLEKLAATYSRASYTGTTIGKTVFDGRVRDGIGSGHSFMATKNRLKERVFPENYTQKEQIRSRVQIAIFLNSRIVPTLGRFNGSMFQRFNLRK